MNPNEEFPRIIEYRRTSEKLLGSGASYQGARLSLPTSRQDVDYINAGRGHWVWEPIGQCATEAYLHIVWRGVWHPGERANEP